MRTYLEALTVHMLLTLLKSGGFWYTLDRAIEANGWRMGLWKLFIACQMKKHDERRGYGLPV